MRGASTLTSSLASWACASTSASRAKASVCSSLRFTSSGRRCCQSSTGEGIEYSVDLVARKATGVEGWKVTVVFLPRSGGGEVKAELPNAASTAEVRRLVTELEGADERLRGMCRAARANLAAPVAPPPST